MRKSYLMEGRKPARVPRFLRSTARIVTKFICAFSSVDFSSSSMSYFSILKIVVVVRDWLLCGEAFFIHLNQQLMKHEALWADDTELTSRNWITLRIGLNLWITWYLCQNYAQGYALTAHRNSGVEFRP